MLCKVKQGLSLLMAVALLASVWGCSSSALPKPGEEALQGYIAQLVGGNVDFKIVSVQKATGPAEELELREFSSGANAVSGCPPDTGDRETWCVVIDRSVVDEAGNAFSHFLVMRLGEVWEVEALTDAEVEAFTYIGCSNW